MQIIFEILFWLGVVLIFYSYAIFPWILHWLARNKKDNDIIFDRSESLPNVFILMSVYNESKVVGQKIESVMDTDYPLDKISFYIGSDSSTDNTNSLVAAFAGRYPQLKFEAYTERNGKSGVLNKLYEKIKQDSYRPDDVFILTDANVFFTRSCIYEMAKHFKNPDIGQVAANVLNSGQREDGISQQESGYIQRENLIKYREGKIWGAMQGAFGACYAMRASCFSPIPPNFLMEDFYISMSILSQGKKAISEFGAICHEDVSNDITEEFKRKTRISTGNFQNLSVFWTRLFRFDAVAFCFYSHKVIRWKGPFIILLMFSAAFILSFYHGFYVFIMAMMVLFFISPLIDRLLQALGINIALLRYIAYFHLMNVALLYGFYKYLAGVQSSAWSPTKRNI